ncbi:MAG: lipopolysaccharide assembly protein LapA domain-containing protein [Nocardioides sp.]
MSEAPEPDPSGPTDDASPTSPESPDQKDPLRASRVGRVWVAVVVFALVLVLLIVFFAQNTDRVAVRFLGWTWHAPLAVVVLSGVVAGMILTVVAGTLRILQLRRRVRHAA